MRPAGSVNDLDTKIEKQTAAAKGRNQGLER